MTRVQPIRSKQQLAQVKVFLKQWNMRNYILFLIGIQTGLRISDILSLKVSDVTGEHIIIFEKKTGKYKEVQMPRELKREIKEFIKGRNADEYLIKSRKGENNPIHRRQAYTILKTVGDKFNLERMGTHSLRKTYGYHHYRTFNDIALLKTALNHTSDKETMIYIGVVQEELNALQNKIDW